MIPFKGQVTFIVQVRLHPQNTFLKEPAYDLYISTGPRSPPIAPEDAEAGAGLSARRGGPGTPGRRREARSVLSARRDRARRVAVPRRHRRQGGDPVAGAARSLALQMSRLNSGLHYGRAEGIFFPAHRCDLVPTKTEPLDALLAIATDLLAQSEAQLRTATRLEQSAAALRARRPRARSRPRIDQVREQLRTLRDLFDAERALLEEFERELSGVDELTLPASSASSFQLPARIATSRFAC